MKYFNYETGEVKEFEEAPGYPWADLQQVPRAIAAIAARLTDLQEEVQRALEKLAENQAKMVKDINRELGRLAKGGGR